MEKNLKKLIIATAVMCSLVPAKIHAAREQEEHSKKEEVALEELTPAQKRERLTPEKRAELDKNLINHASYGDVERVIDLLLNGADPNAELEGEKAIHFSSSTIAISLVFAGADYSGVPLNHWTRINVKNALAEKEKTFNELRILKEALRDQMIKNPLIPVEKLAHLSIDNQIPYNPHNTHKMSNTIIAFEWKKIKKELALEQLEQIVSHVLLDGSLLPIPDIVRLVHNYIHFQKTTGLVGSEKT